MNQEVTVQTTSGPIIGLMGYQFLGIPYGVANRFQTAQSASWNAPKICTKYGSMAIQPNFLGKRKPGVDLNLTGSEDCLNLNIWTPTLDASQKLPVVIYVHGGAFQTGSNSNPDRSGDRFARNTPMVFVSVNYRLGVLGGLYLGDLLGEEYHNSGSNSVLDTLLAIRWVKANAAAFGGDPENITLMGISAGAKCIGALLTIEGIDGLFSKVILESGAVQALRSTTAAKELRDQYMKHLAGVSPEDLPSLPVAKLLEAQAEFCDRDGSTAFFGPVMDGTTFRDDWLTRWDRGGAWKGSALIGSSLHEMCRLAEQPEFLDDPTLVLRDMFGGNGEALLRLHDSSKMDWTKLLSDAMYRSASDRLACRLAQNGNQVWVYSFDYPTAHHGMGFHFIMRQEAAPYCQISESELPTAKKTAIVMNQCVRDFIASGTPDPSHTLGWQAISADSGSKLSFGPQIAFRPFKGDSLAEVPEYTYYERAAHI